MLNRLFQRNIFAIRSTVSLDKDTIAVFVHCDNSFCREERKEQKCLLPGLPAPPCASMQPRQEYPAVQHTGIADSRGGEKGIGEGRECVCVCMCVWGTGRTGEGAGWDEKTPADVSPPMTAPPSLLVCSRFPRQVM